MRRERGGGQSQTQEGQEFLESPKATLFLNLQYKAGPQTARADTTANITRQHLTQFPDRLDIEVLDREREREVRSRERRRESEKERSVIGRV